MSEFFIVDLRWRWRMNRYITLWRPENAGYAWPLPWAGRYDEATVRAHQAYYQGYEDDTLVRWPVPCDVVERLARRPQFGDVDGDVGPVLYNTLGNRRVLRRRGLIRNRTEIEA